MSNFNKPVTTVDEWAAAGGHEVLCPSGVRVTIKVPDLAALIESGELPQNLLDAALATASKVSKGQDQEPSKDLIAKERQFTDFLVSITVVKPSLTVEQASKVPFEDKEMIVAIATRQRDTDAEYQQIGGLSASENWRRFRRVGEFDPALAGV